MNFSRRKGKHRSPSLDPASLRLPLIALIDVVLFLLFYFMVAGNLAAEEAELASALGAKGGGRATSLQTQLLRVEMTDQGPEFRMGGRMMPDRDALRAVLVELPKDPGIILRVDGRVPVETTAAALQTIKDAGFEKITFLAATE